MSVNLGRTIIIARERKDRKMHKIIYISLILLMIVFHMITIIKYFHLV